MKYFILDISNQTKRLSYWSTLRLSVLFIIVALFFAGTQTMFAGSGSKAFLVKGKITDSQTGEALPGANIMVKGTSTGTITDFNGNFSLQVAESPSVLVISFIGYTNQEIEVTGEANLDVALVPSNDMLNEVVVIAYGSTARSNLTGSVVAINEESLKDVFAPNVSNLIQGKVAGLYASTGSGRPGEAASITIRGKGSINTTTAPLWVVDGIIVGNGEPNINPADIESITVLKDASATALYGSRAANGVILVQTQTPEKGVSKLNVNVNRGYTQLSHGNFSLMNAQELFDYQKPWNYEADWWKDDLAANNTNWVDMATQTGVAQEYNANYTGGSDKVTTYLSGTYYNESGAVKGYDYSRYSAIASVNVKATDRLTLKTKISGNHSLTNDQEHSTYSAFTYLPWDKPYKPDGTPIDPKVDKATYGWIGRDESNYLYDLQYNWGKSRDNNLAFDVNAEYKFAEWLTFSSMNSVSLGFGGNEYYTDLRSNSGQESNGSYYVYNSYSQSRFTNQMLRFKKTFGKHMVQSFLAYEFSDDHSEWSDATGKGVGGGLSVLNATAKASSAKGTKYETAQQKVLFNVQYSFNEKYLAQASFSREGTSSFGANNPYGNFWSVSGGWNAHNELFLKNIDWLNVLKLTASYGKVGNSPSGFPSLGYYELTGQYAGNPAARPYQLENKDITWESSENSNIAIETRLFNRLTFTVEAYNKTNSGLLYFVPLSAITGYTGVWKNIGEIENKGVEISFSPEIIKAKDFQWSMDFNIGFNKNRVNELYEDKPITRGNTQIKVGNDMDAFYMYQWYGVNPGNGEPLWEQVLKAKDGSDSTTVLTNSLSNASLQFTGHTASPDFTGGLINNISYKNFSLSANIAFVYGVYKYNSDRQLYDNDGNYDTYNSMNLAEGWSRWRKPGDIATHPKPMPGGNRDANRPSSRFIEDASYLRLRNVTFSYNLPKKWSAKLKLTDTRFYLSADNLYTATKWSGMDPEAVGMYPLAKKVMFGISLNF